MIFQSMKMAWASIVSNKMRSFLTMLGIIIGVTALVVLVSLIQGATGSITSEVEALGSDLLTVTIRDDKGAPLRLEDLDNLTALEEIEQAAPSGSMNATAKASADAVSVSVCGTTPAYFDIQGLALEKGRLLKTADVDNRTSVAVLSHDASESLFGEADAVGMHFALNGRSFEVIGVLAKDDSMMGAMMGGNHTVYIPFSVESRMAGQPYVSSFCVSSMDSADAAEEAVRRTLLGRLGLSS